MPQCNLTSSIVNHLRSWEFKFKISLEVNFYKVLSLSHTKYATIVSCLMFDVWLLRKLIGLL